MTADEKNTCREFLEQRLDRIERLAKSELRKKNCIDPPSHSGDVVGDVSVKILKQWAKLRSPDDALNTITINTARTHAYNCRREVPLKVDDDATPVFSKGAVDPPTMLAQARLIEQLLSTLGETDQQIISLRFQDFDYDQIAAILDMSSSAVRSRYSRAVRRLQEVVRLQAGSQLSPITID